MSVRIRVIDDVYGGHYGDGVDSDEQYSNRGTSYETHHIKGIEIVPEGEYFDLTVGFEVRPGADYWLVYGNYDTGDSFGRDEGKIVFIDLFDDVDAAWECARALEAHAKKESKDFPQLTYEQEEALGGKFESDYSCKIINSDGNEQYVHIPWKGYFETFGGIEVDKVEVKYRSH